MIYPEGFFNKVLTKSIALTPKILRLWMNYFYSFMGSKMIICLGYLCLQMAKGLWANSVTALLPRGISVSSVIKILLCDGNLMIAPEEDWRNHKSSSKPFLRERESNTSHGNSSKMSRHFSQNHKCQPQAMEEKSVGFTLWGCECLCKIQ